MNKLIFLLVSFIQISSCVVYLHRYSDTTCDTQRENLVVVPYQSDCWQNTKEGFYGLRPHRFEISWPANTTNSTYMYLRYCTDKTYGDVCCGDNAASIVMPFNECIVFSDFSLKVNNTLVGDFTYTGFLPLAIGFDVFFTIVIAALCIFVKVKKVGTKTVLYRLIRFSLPLFLILGAFIGNTRIYNTQNHAGMEFLTLGLIRIVFAFELKKIVNLTARWIVKFVLAFLIYINYFIFFIFVPEDVLFYVYLLLVKQALFLNLLMQFMEDAEGFKVDFPTRFSRMHAVGDLFLAIYTFFCLIYHLYADRITAGMSLSNSAIVFQSMVLYIIFTQILMGAELIERIPHYVFYFLLAAEVVYSLIQIFDEVSDYGKPVAVTAAIIMWIWGILYAALIELYAITQSKEVTVVVPPTQMNEVEVKNEGEKKQEEPKKQEEKGSAVDDVKAGAD